MSEDLLRLQFDILSRRIGSEVSCKVWESGKEKTYTGVLVDVVPFDFINLSRQLIPFVGVNQAIEEINLVEKDGKPVYTNPRVQGYEGYTAKDVMGLVNAQNEILGRSVKMEEMQGRTNEGKHK